MKHFLWHRFILAFLRVVAGPFIKRIMKYSCKKQKAPDKPSLIISNHNTDLDPALVALGFSRHMYFLASEHAFRNGFPSKVMRFIFDPIPFNKTQTDISSIKEMIRRLKAGASVCLFAEGDRSFSGTTAPVAISTAKLVKASRADLITYRLEGGYFTSPRWSKSFRKGKMTGGIVNKYSADEIRAMNDEQVLSVIQRDIYENAYDRQNENLVRFRGKNLAENIETALYLCPECKQSGTIRSTGNNFSCDCGLRGEYLETGFLQGDSLPFTTIAEWDIWQAEQMKELISASGDGTICSDENQQLFEVRAAEGKTLVGEGAMLMDRKSFRCAGMTFPMECITRFAIVGQMTLLFAVKDGPAYEIRSAAPRSALKYRDVFQFLTEKLNP